MALTGLTVIELGGLAPAPFCGMILADFGAEVIRVDKIGAGSTDGLCRGKRSLALNLKTPEGIAVLRKLCNNADVLVEPFRKGVMERLGLGPEQLLKENTRLIYARMTGYGQDGPLSDKAGHDINYLAVSGLLSMLGRKSENPCPPINLMGDFAGGGLICTLGILMALIERNRSGQGQVVDANMVEGANYVGSFVYTLRDRPLWGTGRGTGILDGGSPWYATYKTKDDKFMAVGAIEPQFYTKLLACLGLTLNDTPQFGEMESIKAKFTKIFASKTQAEWCTVFDDMDACVTPIVPWDEAADYSHNKARGSFMKNASGLAIPTPAPRLSRTPAQATTETYLNSGLHSKKILSESGFSQSEIAVLIDMGVVDDIGDSGADVVQRSSFLG